MTTTSAIFLDFASTAGAEIEGALEQYTRACDGCPERLRAAMRHSLLAPGKRLRPLLVLMAAEACGCPSGGAMPAACAVEFIHTYSLIHDDLPAMDDDDMRRGRPSCHREFGEATAILAGDALLTQAFEILSCELPPTTAARACAILATAAGRQGMVGGQQDDLSAEEAGGDLATLESIHARKTGALFTAALRLGGVVAGAETEQQLALEKYGEKLGLAFQIVDDLLDRHGDMAALGKHTGKDEERGKLTFPALLGVTASRQRAEQLIADAREALCGFGDRASRLEALAHYVLERNR